MGGGLLKTNNQLERFTEDKKSKKIICFVLGLFLIIGCITFYKTFAFYKEEAKFNVIRGRVPNFVANDLTLALTLNGEEVETYPEKGEYKVEVTCDQGAIGIWDYEEWSINIKNVKKKRIRCQIDFETIYKEKSLNGAEPNLGDELIPIVIGNNGVVTYADPTTEWYNYENKNWANAVILLDDAKNKYKVGDTISESDIESYFVWIPKYAYKIQSLGTNKTNQPFEIRFGTTNTINSDTECIAPNVSGENGSCGVGKYMTHPAFTSFGDIKGLWVGKFETGYKGSTDIASAEKNENNPTKVQIKPNVNSWRNITASNMFKTSYNYKRNLESHMMKNTEWGAVAYLTHSIYGRCNGTTCEEVYINNNSNYVTGWSGTSVSASSSSSSGYAYNNANSVKASSTGNDSGIYDLSGGAWEYVAGVREDLTSGSGGFTLSDISTYNKKYYDTYSISVDSSSTYTTRILGDATAETKGWNDDYASYVNSSNPWFYRGGYYNFTSSAGVFLFNGYNGTSNSDIGFRVVLAY